MFEWMKVSTHDSRDRFYIEKGFMKSFGRMKTIQSFEVAGIRLVQVRRRRHDRRAELTGGNIEDSGPEAVVVIRHAEATVVGIHAVVGKNLLRSNETQSVDAWSERMKGSMNKRLSEWIKDSMNEWINKWMNEWKGQWINLTLNWRLPRELNINRSANVAREYVQSFVLFDKRVEHRAISPVDGVTIRISPNVQRRLIVPRDYFRFATYVTLLRIYSLNRNKNNNNHHHSKMNTWEIR